MPKSDLIRFNAIKDYITTVKNFRSSKGAIERLIANFESAIIAVVSDAEAQAREDKRSTILEEDITQSLEKHLGKKDLSSQELAEAIIGLNATNIGDISKSITEYVRKKRAEG